MVSRAPELVSIESALWAPFRWDMGALARPLLRTLDLVDRLLAFFDRGLECAPGAGQIQAAVLTICRAWLSSNWAGLR
jgi:hypothetical protein